MHEDITQSPNPQTLTGSTPTAESDYLTQMVDISKSFGGLEVLNEVNLSVKQGEVLGLVGDNGAGKSSLMKILTGAYHPDAGQILFHNAPVHIRRPQDSRKLGIEMIYQDLALCQNRNVSANMFLGRELVRFSLPFGFLKLLDWPEMKRQTEQILGNIHIKVKSLDMAVEKLSGGQRQAVAIGRAISFEPKLVIMDEPTASLALKEVETVLQLIRNLRQKGISVIIISHRIEDIFDVADRITVLRAGRVVGTYDIQSVSPEDIVHAMFLGRSANITEKVVTEGSE